MTQTAQTHHTTTHLSTNGIATLTLRNAKKLNIVGTPAILELTAAIQALKQRGDVRVLVLRGVGDTAFIGGADIYEMSALTQPSAEAFITRLKNLCEAVRSFPSSRGFRATPWAVAWKWQPRVTCASAAQTACTACQR